MNVNEEIKQVRDNINVSKSISRGCQISHHCYIHKFGVYNSRHTMILVKNEEVIRPPCLRGACAFIC
nr:hypothetical protein [Tanacetum cinerariifolium]